MRFAFLVHRLNHDMASMVAFDEDGVLQGRWGSDPLGVCAHLHEAVAKAQNARYEDAAPEVRVIDSMTGLRSGQGSTCEGRLYEIPMDGLSIVSQPEVALGFMQQAVEMAEQWGARVVGLGSMTGIVGGRGRYLAHESRIAVTTGNSLTTYSALQNLFHAAEELDIDLARESVAVVGIPGSIATAAAALLAPRCRELILVGHRMSAPASRLAKALDAELLLDIPAALARARVVLTATSTGGCIDQSWLLPGSLVIDVGVPTDVDGAAAERHDALILTGGLVGLPQTMPLHSKFLWFQHGMVPSCLGETMLLALEKREECFSLGRNLKPESIEEIGRLARSHGFDFTRLYAFGNPLDDAALINVQKNRRRCGPVSDGRDRDDTPTRIQRTARRAAALHGRHINPVLIASGRTSGFVKTFVRGDGVYLFDAEEKPYLDFVSGFGSVNMGHNHPHIVRAVQEALSAQVPGFAQAAVNPFASELAKELVLLAPPGLEMVSFANSGAEAVEAALKLARAATGRRALLSCEGAYHGKTLGALSITGNAGYRRPFEPLVPECEAIPYADYDALERALATRRFAAFAVEPIQGEAGMIVPQAGYLREAQALCRSHGTLLVVDEIQTGLGRTGDLFAVDRETVQPDVMTLAKSLGGGLMPIGAMLTRRDLWRKAYGSIQSFALHTSTFAGGSLACVAGLAALSVLGRERLVENARERGVQLAEGIATLCRRHRCLREVRGRGLLLGVEFHPLPPSVKDHWDAIDATGMLRYLGPDLDEFVDSFHVMHALHTLLEGHGIYAQAARSNPRVLRVEPPLTISEQLADRFLAALASTCDEIDYSLNLLEEMIAKTGIGRHNAADRGSALPAPRTS